MVLISNLQTQILEILNDSDDPLGITDLAGKLSRSYPTVKKAIDGLVEARCIRELRSLPGDGRKGKLYIHIAKAGPERYQVELPEPETKRHRPVGQISVATPPLSARELKDLLYKWSQTKWVPRIFKTARNLPLSVARYYELAISITYGSTVPIADFDEVRANIIAFRTDLESTLAVVNALLSTPDLSNASDAYNLLIAHENVPDLEELVRRVKEAN